MDAVTGRGRGLLPTASGRVHFLSEGAGALHGAGRRACAPGMGWDREEVRGLDAARLSLKPEVIRGLPGRGRVRGSLDWIRVSATGRLPLFLGMAEGHRAGHNLVWRVGVDYRLARYLTALLVYDGRRRPGRPVLHLGRVEVRARF